MNCTNKYVSINCEAKECDHNEHGVCVSEIVEIGCDDEKVCKHNTACKTFSI